jgi:hypothetical protein
MRRTVYKYNWTFLNRLVASRKGETLVASSPSERPLSSPMPLNFIGLACFFQRCAFTCCVVREMMRIADFVRSKNVRAALNLLAVP